jgi:curved DNA-binding protein CbpA
MGQIQSSHVRIYNDLIRIGDPATRVRTLETVLLDPNCIASAKQAGIYGQLLHYIRGVRAGERVPFPGEKQPSAQPSAQPSPAVAAAQRLQTPKYVGGTIQTYTAPAPAPAWQVVSATPSSKALDYFTQCLNVLGIADEDDLTEDLLKIAYKKAALRAHPDKGGSEARFEAVTRAHAYLTEILRRIRGTRKVTSEQVSAPAALQKDRTSDAKAWEQVQPVRLDPKNLNMTVFNQLYEQTRIPDPEDDGYGDWLKDEDGSAAAPKFSGKYNRDVFNKMFQEEATKKATSTQLILHPEMMALNSSAAGVEIGRDKPQTYTAPANADLQYTDLRAAYTTENTISPYVANVKVEERNLKDYKESYKAGPKALSPQEQAALDQYKIQQQQYEVQRQRRAAQDDLNAASYFERMKRLALTQ